MTGIVGGHCPLNHVTHIGRVKDKILVTMDDCTYYTADPTVLDLVSLSGSGVVIKDIKPSSTAGHLVLTLVDLGTGTETTKEIAVTLPTEHTVPNAGYNVKGLVALASDSDAIAGVSTEKALTPSTGVVLVKQQTTALKNSVDDLTSKVNKVSHDLSVYQPDLSGVNTKIGDLNTALSNLKQQVSGLPTSTSIPSNLTDKINTLSNNYDTVHTTTDDIKKEIVLIEKDIAELQGKMDQNILDITSLKGRTVINKSVNVLKDISGNTLGYLVN